MNASLPETIIETPVRDALEIRLNRLHISIVGHSFYTFRRLGATLAFDMDVPLANIMSHGLWRSDAVWTPLLGFRLHLPLLQLLGLGLGSQLGRNVA